MVQKSCNIWRFSIFWQKKLGGFANLFAAYIFFIWIYRQEKKDFITVWIMASLFLYCLLCSISCKAACCVVSAVKQPVVVYLLWSSLMWLHQNMLHHNRQHHNRLGSTTTGYATTRCTTAATPQQAASRQLHYNRLHHSSYPTTCCTPSATLQQVALQQTVVQSVMMYRYPVVAKPVVV